MRPARTHTGSPGLKSRAAAWKSCGQRGHARSIGPCADTPRFARPGEGNEIMRLGRTRRGRPGLKSRATAWKPCGLRGRARAASDFESRRDLHERSRVFQHRAASVRSPRSGAWDVWLGQTRRGRPGLKSRAAAWKPCGLRGRARAAGDFESRRDFHEASRLSGRGDERLRTEAPWGGLGPRTSCPPRARQHHAGGKPPRSALIPTRQPHHRRPRRRCVRRNLTPQSGHPFAATRRVAAAESGGRPSRELLVASTPLPCRTTTHHSFRFKSLSLRSSSSCRRSAAQQRAANIPRARAALTGSASRWQTASSARYGFK